MPTKKPAKKKPAKKESSWNLPDLSKALEARAEERAHGIGETLQLGE